MTPKEAEFLWITMNQATAGASEDDTTPKVWLPGKKKRKTVQYGVSRSQPGYAPSTMPTGRSYTETVGEGGRDPNEVFSWIYDRKKSEKIFDFLEKRGFTDLTFEKAEGLWEDAVLRAQNAYMGSGKKNKVSPWDMLDLISPAEEEKELGPWRGLEFSETTTSKNIYDMAPETARALINNAATELLGRAPTREEIEDFASRANAVVGANPQVSKTTTDYEWDPEAGPDGGDYRATGSTTVEKGRSQEEVMLKLQQEAEDDAKMNPEYGEAFASQQLVNWLFSALESPV